MQIETNFIEFKNSKYIRRLAFTLVVISLSCSGALALDPMGPPTTGLVEGQFELGIDYSSSTMDLELTGGKYSEWNHATSEQESGEAESFTLNDFETNKIYTTLGYGIWEYCDVYLRLGLVNAEFGDSIWEAGEEFDHQTDFTFCIGSRATFYEDGDFKLGRMIQLSWANLDGVLKAPQWTEDESSEIELIELQASVGPTFTLPNGTLIYGGPFLHFVGGDIEEKFNDINSEGDDITANYTWDIEESSVFGGYIGAQITFDEYSFFNIEYQFTSGADLLGLSFIYRF
jgi:hypothetical protein